MPFPECFRYLGKGIFLNSPLTNRPVGLYYCDMPKPHAKEKLIGAAIEQMMAKGYSATGVEDLCTQAGVSKGAFYHHFPTKEDLAIAALQDFYAGGLQELSAIKVDDALPPDQFPLYVERLALESEMIWRHGCLIGSLATEMAHVSPLLQEKVSVIFTDLTAVLARLAVPFVDSLQNNVTSAEEFAEQLLLTIEGAIVLAQAHADPSRIKKAISTLSTGLRALQRVSH